MTKIGFLGPQGTFSHEALYVYTKGKDDFKECSYANIPEILQAVISDEIDEAIVPIENSIEGSINVTLDMLAFDVDLKIKTEIIVPITQNLLIKKGMSIESIKYLLSHPQAIGQCRKYISNKLKNTEIRFVYSTAEAAIQVANYANIDTASIGSAIAAHIYNVDIYESGIQDEDNNSTRFVVIAKSEASKTGKDKTSIIFSTEDKPGSLYRILDILSIWNINMTRIESRPAKNKLGNYIFFIDILGHKDDIDIKDALQMVNRKTTFYKILGSYPVAD